MFLKTTCDSSYFSITHINFFIIKLLGIRIWISFGNFSNSNIQFWDSRCIVFNCCTFGCRLWSFLLLLSFVTTLLLFILFFWFLFLLFFPFLVCSFILFSFLSFSTFLFFTSLFCGFLFFLPCCFCHCF